MTEGQLSLLQKDPQFQCFKLPSESQLEPLESKCVVESCVGAL